MTVYLYKSTTGKTINADGLIVSTTGLQLKAPIRALDSLVGISLSRYTNGVLDIIDNGGSSLLTTSARTLTIADTDTVIKCTGAATLTIATDINGDFTSADSVVIIRMYQASVSAVSFAAASGVTLHGTPRTAAQYVVQSIMRVGANEWVYF